MFEYTGRWDGNNKRAFKGLDFKITLLYTLGITFHSPSRKLPLKRWLRACFLLETYQNSLLCCIALFCFMFRIMT